MTLDDQKAGFDLIKRARERYSLMAPCKASADTQQGYERQYDLLVRTGGEATEIWLAVCRTSSKRTYYSRVAALRYTLRVKLGKCLQHQDLCQRARDWAGWQVELKKISRLMELDQLVIAAAGHCPLESPKPRTSKRQHLKKFPTDFRDQLATRFRGMPYEAAYLVSALTGCRPHELQTGVIVSRTPNGVVISVCGAKQKGDTQGQKLRVFEYGVHPYTTRLLEVLNISHGATAQVAVPSKVKWTTVLRGVGWALWPITVKDKDKDKVKKIEITPYLLRHALASDMKRQGWDPDEISSALGHLSAKTRSLYGHRNSGGSSPWGLKGVTATRPVRSVERQESFDISALKRGPRP